MPKQGTWKKIYRGFSLLRADGESILSVTEWSDGMLGTIYWRVRMDGEAGVGKRYNTLSGAKRYAWRFAEDVPFKHEFHVVIRTDMDAEVLARGLNRGTIMECSEIVEYVDLEGTTFKKMEVVWQA